MKQLITLMLLVAAPAAWGESPSAVFVSGTSATTVVELFTSEGCSSCPPAERWLSGLKSDPGLWHDLVPLAFHVDYWDDLGWRDRFSSHEFSERQQRYQASGHVGSVYTPGFVIDGGEWRGFFNPIDRLKALPHSTRNPGILVLAQKDDGWVVQFKGDPARHLIAHIAWLGMGLNTPVARGENAGKTLAEDFVVLDHRKQPGAGTWTFRALKRPPNASAIAAWIADPNDPTPIQAVAGPINN